MSGKRLMVFCVALLAINLEIVKAELSNSDKEKILTFLLPHIAECAKDNAIADGVIDTVLETGKFSVVNPCFLACVMKRIDLLDKNGKLSDDKVAELSKEYLSSEDQKAVPDIMQSCDGVNEKEVSDGDKGCERVNLILVCADPFLSVFFPTK